MQYTLKKFLHQESLNRAEKEKSVHVEKLYKFEKIFYIYIANI